MVPPRARQVASEPDVKKTEASSETLAQDGGEVDTEMS
jgi:hypothetical protein